MSTPDRGMLRRRERQVEETVGAFSPAEMKECYAYMEVPEAYAGRVDALIASLKASLRELTSD